MQKNTKRVAIAAGMSLSGFVFTFVWYHFSSQDFGGGNKSKQIARLTISHNEVQRKPITKLIWQPVGENELLFIGEAIRTAADSEATIEFLDGKTKIELDPDSAIVLEENAGKIALNFLQGNMFVKAEGSSADTGLTLSSGGKQIALGKSELSLGKSASGQLDLQVLKGQAQIESNGKMQTIEQGKSMTGATFKLIAPTSDSPIFTDKTKNEKVAFEWAPIDQTYTVHLEAGPTRTSIKAVEGAASLGTAGKLEAAMKYGRVFYRLVAQSSDPQKPELSTLVFKNEVVAIVPPTLLEPEKDKPIILNVDSAEVKFAWSNPSQYEKVTFELARNPAMKNPLKKDLTDTDEFNYKFKEQGNYYWRVSGFVKGRKELIASDIQGFQVKLFKGLQSPIVELPLQDEKMSAPNVGLTTVAFSWQPVPSATQYKVILESTTLKNGKSETESEITQVRVRDLKPGSYTWSVVALDDKGKSSLPSEKRKFDIVNLPVIEWGKIGENVDHEYVSLKPTIELDWKPSPNLPIVSYNIKVTASESGEVISQKATMEKATVSVPADGEYYAEVEGVSKSGQALARTSRKRLQVHQAALLPAPQFAQNIPSEILANGSGLAKLAWTTVPGATKYMVILQGKPGDPARELAFESGDGELKNLMPGDYSVSLKAIDRFGRPGQTGESRPLKVPATSGVKAPKLKGIKVK